MSPDVFKKIGRFLKAAYKDLDAEAMKSGVSPASEEYLDIQNKIRDEALSRWGYSLEEYNKTKEEVIESQKKTE